MLESDIKSLNAHATARRFGVYVQQCSAASAIDVDRSNNSTGRLSPAMVKHFVAVQYVGVTSTRVLARLPAGVDVR
jgi:hypothetical protein